MAAAQPLLRMHALLARMRPAFPECALSLGLLWEWVLDQITIQLRWRRDILALDDEIEKVAPLLAECLRNDPPWKRRKIWSAWKATHARTATLAAEVAPPDISFRTSTAEPLNPEPLNP